MSLLREQEFGTGNLMISDKLNFSDSTIRTIARLLQDKGIKLVIPEVGVENYFSGELDGRISVDDRQITYYDYKEISEDTIEDLQQDSEAVYLLLGYKLPDSVLAEHSADILVFTKVKNGEYSNMPLYCAYKNIVLGGTKHCIAPSQGRSGNVQGIVEKMVNNGVIPPSEGFTNPITTDSEAVGVHAVTLKEYREILAKQVVANMTKAIMKNKEDELAAARLRCSDTAMSVHTHREHFMMAVRNKQEADERLEMLLTTVEDNTDEKVAEIMQELMESPKLDYFLVTLNQNGQQEIHFFTKDISITDIYGNVHPIGKFDARVNLYSSETILMNLDNKIDKVQWRRNYDEDLPIHHPHCNSYGAPCMGNLATYLADACAEKDIVGIWQLILSYLQSYNEHDIWGKRLRYWKTDKGETVKVYNEQAEDGTLVCAHCDEEVDVDDMVVCADCGDNVCTDCAVLSDTINDEESYYCPECSNRHMTSADEVMPMGIDIITCDICGDRVAEYEVIYGNGDGRYCSEECLAVATEREE